MGSHPDPEIRRGPNLINFFWPFGPQFALKIMEGGIPDPSPGLITDLNELRDIFLAPVVQKVDNAIQQVNLYLVDSGVGFPNSYPRNRSMNPSSGLTSILPRVLNVAETRLSSVSLKA